MLARKAYRNEANRFKINFMPAKIEILKTVHFREPHYDVVIGRETQIHQEVTQVVAGGALDVQRLAQLILRDYAFINQDSRYSQPDIFAFAVFICETRSSFKHSEITLSWFSILKRAHYWAGRLRRGRLRRWR